jgi:hypothetical protein
MTGDLEWLSVSVSRAAPGASPAAVGGELPGRGHPVGIAQSRERAAQQRLAETAAAPPAELDRLRAGRAMQSRTLPARPGADAPARPPKQEG